MQYSDLSLGEEIVRSGSITDIGYGLALALMPGERYVANMRALDGPSSCCVFLTELHPEAQSCSDGVRDIVRNLLSYLHPTQEGAEPARMPEDKPHSGSRKGWSIQKTTINGYPAAIATAVWLH